ncbi:MAG: aldehyde ferredoxin oxidoreductase family protein [Coriobacteriia bacterium]
MGGSGTFSVVTKGPMTNGATTTQANGYLGAFLRLNGYDAIAFTGASPTPVYLEIRDGKAELRDATALMGKDTWDTKTSLCSQLGLDEHRLSVFGIGPAGEKGVRFAAIVGDHGHMAAHNGAGAVMGSKNLKAVAIARAAGGFTLADPEGLSHIANEWWEFIKNHPRAKNHYNWGTSRGFVGGVTGGWLPVKNYTTNLFPDAESFMGEHVRARFEIKRSPCWACQMHHCHIMKITEGPYAGFVGEEPEYEQWASWGPLIGNTQVDAAMVLSNEVDRLGMDTNEAGWVVSWAMDCYTRGLLTRNDLDGLDLSWGNAEAVRVLLRKIAHREGIGDLLAEGVKRASQKIGGEAAACAIYTEKGNSPRTHDHRSRWLEMLDTATSNTGTIETGPVFYPKEVGMAEPDQLFSPNWVATINAKAKGWFTYEDSLGTCRLCTQVPIDWIAKAVNCATGWDSTGEEAMEVGRRTVNLLRVFNFRAGITAESERPSTRYASTPVDGPVSGVSVLPHWSEMVGLYYELMGWDRQSGRPLPETLRGFGLEKEAADLWGNNG